MRKFSTTAFALVIISASSLYWSDSAPTVRYSCAELGVLSIGPGSEVRVRLPDSVNLNTLETGELIGLETSGQIMDRFGAASGFPTGHAQLIMERDTTGNNSRVTLKVKRLRIPRLDGSVAVMEAFGWFIGSDGIRGSPVEFNRAPSDRYSIPDSISREYAAQGSVVFSSALPHCQDERVSTFPVRLSLNHPAQEPLDLFKLPPPEPSYTLRIIKPPENTHNLIAIDPFINLPRRSKQAGE